MGSVIRHWARIERASKQFRCGICYIKAGGGAGTSTRQKEPRTKDAVIERVQNYLSGKPIALISTAEAIEEAEDEGQM
jgi:hypothetical protein